MSCAFPTLLIAYGQSGRFRESVFECVVTFRAGFTLSDSDLPRQIYIFYIIYENNQMKFSSVREYSPVFSCFVMIVSPYFPPFLVITPPRQVRYRLVTRAASCYYSVCHPISASFLLPCGKIFGSVQKLGEF